MITKSAPMASTRSQLCHARTSFRSSTCHATTSTSTSTAVTLSRWMISSAVRAKRPTKRASSAAAAAISGITSNQTSVEDSMSPFLSLQHVQFSRIERVQAPVDLSRQQHQDDHSKHRIGRNADLNQLRRMVGEQRQRQVRTVFHQAKSQDLLEDVTLS